MMIATSIQENVFNQGTLEYYLQLGYPKSEAEYMAEVYQSQGESNLFNRGTLEYYLQLEYPKSEAEYMAEVYQSQGESKDNYLL